MGEKEHKTQVTKSIEENAAAFRNVFANCDDIKMCEMSLGNEAQVRALIAYIEVSVGNMLVEQSVIGKLLNHLCELDEEHIYECLASNNLGISDVTVYQTIEEAADGLLIGEAILFIDGFSGALKIPDKGYPAKSIGEPESERGMRGSKEAFTDSVKTNAALIRKRLRTPKVKVKSSKAGVRSNINVYLVFMEELICEELLETIEERLGSFEIDGVLDSGIIEQLTEDTWYSPFPQFQTTQRPDRAAMAILEGRIVLMSENSPEALLLPTDYNSFVQTSDDYYKHWEIASFTRCLRYIATFLAMAFPALYLVVLNFDTKIIPTNLLMSLAFSRQGVPFPAVVELLLLELAFELLREAGVRMPGGMGNAMGIVGGIIIGQAAVDVNLVSPIVVIIVAFTALCSFTIPNEEFASAFRLIKYALIIVCAWLGYFGLILALLTLLIHLSSLKSFGIPYLMPFVGRRGKEYEETTDSFVRFPTFLQRRRPVYANKEQKVRLKTKGK